MAKEAFSNNNNYIVHASEDEKETAEVLGCTDMKQGLWGKERWIELRF